jgi:5'-methylthioadenosine phosphorylase
MVKVGIIGGSGLDDPKLLKNSKEIKVNTPYGEPSSELTCGKIKGVDVVILARHGKEHSIWPTGVNFRANIQALKDQKCTHILATTAIGSLRARIKPSDIVFPDQFIDFTKHRNLTFHDKDVVHTPMADPFCSYLRELLYETAKKLHLSCHNGGTVVTIEGPRFSTRAESEMFRLFGADVINMSTVPEVILAREAKMCYATIAMSTDYDCWKDDEESVTWEIIVKRMKENANNVKKLLFAVISKIKNEKCKCRS